MSQRWRKSRTAVVGMVLLTFSCLSSCGPREDEIVPPVQQPPPPSPPLPENACATNVLLGYTDKVSYKPDEEVKAYLLSSAIIELCRLDIYDVNRELKFSVSSPLTTLEITVDRPSEDGFGFNTTVKFVIPESLPSGMYLIEKKIPFIIKSEKEVDLLIVYPSNTANAYSESGGKSLYTPAPNRPDMVSFLRPMALQPSSTVCLKWFSEMKDVDIGYVGDNDLEDYETVRKAKILVIIGHSEYWTRNARQNFDKFINDGKHALVLSGNTMWWQVRYTNDGTGLICYKNNDLDPAEDPMLKTIEWTNSSLQYSIFSSIGADFPHGGYGMKSDNGWNGFKIVNENSPLLQGLGLHQGDIISCPTSEYDGSLLSGFDDNGYPVLDKDALDFEKIELIGFDLGFRIKETIGTFVVMRKTNTSGIIVNTSSMDWCSESGMGGTSGAEIKKITLNAIQKLLTGETLFAN
jgi:hypothetical protein